MSATTPPTAKAKRSSGLRHHATRPHGIILIGALIFVIAWAFWTFFLASPVIAP